MPILRAFISLFNRFLPGLGFMLSRLWFEFISRVDSGDDMLFMNYGYAELDASMPPLRLRPEDERHRYPIQLYNKVAGAVDMRNLEVLEIGSGRGGGAAYMADCLEPKSVVGLDITASAIDFCRRRYGNGRLSFVRGDAQSLEFSDESFDVVVSIESSICYPDVEAFFSEVVRVLRPLGYFLYADLRQAHELDTWQAQISRTGLKVVLEEVITSNILRALDLDDQRKRELIERRLPRPMHRPFGEFAGLKGSQFFYGDLLRGEKSYHRFVLQKAGPSLPPDLVQTPLSG